VVTLLALELREEPQSNDSPATRLERCNDLFAEIEDVLAKQDARIIQYRGEGFLALCRGRDHARRAVSAALDVVQTLQEFNRPRRVLGWPVWQVCQALTGGLVCIDKVGTCRKFDRIVAGPPVALVARLLAEAEVNRPCVDEVTFEAAAALFSGRPGGGRTVHLKALGPQRVWDLMR
jgi:class 3 adenylate cyclase